MLPAKYVEAELRAAEINRAFSLSKDFIPPSNLSLHFNPLNPELNPI